jgi:hypothetical protein
VFGFSPFVFFAPSCLIMALPPGCQAADVQSGSNRANRGVWSLGRAERRTARSRPATQPLTVCPLTGTLTTASFRACDSRPAGKPVLPVPGARHRGRDAAFERSRILLWPIEAQVRGRGDTFRRPPSGVGWTAVSRAATLLVCAAFCLEPCQDIRPDDFLGARWSARKQLHTAAAAASAAPVLGRTHLGSFPPCEDQPYVERIRTPPCLFRQDHRAT